MLKPLNFTPPPEHVTLQAEIDRAEITRLRALLTEASDEILFWRKNAQDCACPDRTKPFTVGVENDR